MKIDYSKILQKNMINVLKEVLIYIEKNGLEENHHLYIALDTQNLNFNAPDWIKEKYPKDMTIVIQHEYWNFSVKDIFFTISLSFDNIAADLEIPFNSIISFADPYANFGLKLKHEEKKDLLNLDEADMIKNSKNNVIDFKKFKKY